MSIKNQKQIQKNPRSCEHYQIRWVRGEGKP